MTKSRSNRSSKTPPMSAERRWAILRQIEISGATKIAFTRDAPAMKFHRGETGTGSLRGYVDTTYSQLCKAFGEPVSGLEVPANWDLVFEDGTTAEIYVYKTYSIPTCLYSWHVQSRSNLGVARVAEVLGTDYYLLEWTENHSEDELPF